MSKMPTELSAVAAAQQIRDGDLTSVELVTAYCQVIAETDEKVKAWVDFDAQKALDQAASADYLHRHGRAQGALHGVPVGIKDIIDTADMPTQMGSQAYVAHQPDKDAFLVSKLKEAGAVIMGKTVTAECAYLTPNGTRNPHDLSRTPGGSSSGSAAAVAAGQVPLSVGTQTGGSVIRPASFCGVYGLKPSQGFISRTGVLPNCPTLDQIGVFGRSLQDIGLLSDILSGFDAQDPHTYTRPKPSIHKGANEDAPVPPLFAVFRLPYDDQFEASTQANMEALVETLGAQCEMINAPEAFSQIPAAQTIIQQVETARNLEQVYRFQPELLSEGLIANLKAGSEHTDEAYARAIELVAQSKAFFAEFFCDYDAVITPAALGEAPVGLETTGNPICSIIWQFAGLPCVSLPLMSGDNGMPVGLQLVTGIEDDDRLCRTANWLIQNLE